MNGNLDGVYENSKKIEFLNSLIKEKTEEIALLNEKIADYRKKNGKALKTEYDLLIYQTNMQISNLSKSISECKREIRRMKIESGDFLRAFYAEATTIEKKAEAETAMKRLYGNRAILTGISENQAENKKVGFVYTDERKNKGKIRRLVKAGIKSDSGKLIAMPEVEVYEYVGDDDPVIDLDSPEAIEILESSAEKPRPIIGEAVEKEVKEHPCLDRLVACFDNKIKIFAVSLLFAFFTALAFWASAAGYARGFTENGNTALFSSAFILFATAFSIVALKDGKFGGIWDISPIFSVLVGIILFVCYFAFGYGGFGIVAPIEFTAYGIAFYYFRVRFGKEGNGKRGADLAFGVISGMTFALFCAKVYNYEYHTAISRSSVYGGSVWAIFLIIFTVVWLASLSVIGFAIKGDPDGLNGRVLLISASFSLILVGAAEIETLAKILFCVFFGLNLIAFAMKNLLPRRKNDR
ncbi:MAG: hypothetical protein IJ800_04545 [Clostridia bacterium]|nr:hypothetical protein [Clostridia bacterium]